MAVVARFNNQLKLDNNSETSALAIDAQQLSSQLTGRGNRLHFVALAQGDLDLLCRL